jgi:hypothetical protein
MRLLEKHLKNGANGMSDIEGSFEGGSDGAREATAFQIRKTGREEKIRINSCFPAFLLSSEIFLIRFFVNRRPSEVMPDADDDGNPDREVYSVFLIAPRGGEQRANGQSVVNHPGCDARNSIGNTIGTSRADPQDESNLCAATPTAVATRSRQNNSVMLALDRAKAWPA